MKQLCDTKADIILLTETWTWAHGDDALPNLPEFVQWSIARPKAHNKRGRHAGGVAVFFKREYSKHMTPISAEVADEKLWVKLDKSVGLSEDLRLCLWYLPPENPPQHTRANIVKTYDTLTEEIIKAREMGSVLLAGDLNARTGELQEAASLSSGLPQHIQPETEFLPARASVDARKRDDLSGRALIELCDRTDLVIVNGETEGDFESSYTHQSNTRGREDLGGQSVVDYFVADRIFLKTV
jgi:hypothetical protein